MQYGQVGKGEGGGGGVVGHSKTRGQSACRCRSLSCGRALSSRPSPCARARAAPQGWGSAGQRGFLALRKTHRAHHLSSRSHRISDQRFEPKVRARWRTGEREGASLDDELRHTRGCCVCVCVRGVLVCGVRVIMCMRRRAHLGLHRLGRRCHALIQLDHAFPQLVGQLLEKADAQQLRRAVCTLGYASGQDA